MEPHPKNSSSPKPNAPMRAVERSPAPLPVDGQGSLSDSDYDFVRALVYREARIDLGENKNALVTARLGRRLRETGIPSFTAYCDSIRKRFDPLEINHLIDAISTNHTHFFREPAHFDFLRRVALPKFEKGTLGNPNRFNIWSAACSTGEEPYSLAICLEEFFSNRDNRTWEVTASDISAHVLKVASEGVYPESRLKNLSPVARHRHFQTLDGRHFKVASALQKRIRFHRLNLFAPRYPWRNPFHVILCRNAMIYFDQPSQKKLVDRLSRHLVPGGYLIIGHAESLTGIRNSFKLVQSAVYQLPPM